MSFRIATPDDAPALAAFAERTFRETFGPYNAATDLDAHCALTYSVARVRKDLADPARHTLVVERDGALAGYAQLVSAEPPACITGPAPIELLRFYVDRRWHGAGLAQSMMAQVVEAARARDARTLFLGVWEHNPRALAFYAKCGFRPVGARPFAFGAKVDNDLLLARAIR